MSWEVLRMSSEYSSFGAFPRFDAVQLHGLRIVVLDEHGAPGRDDFCGDRHRALAEALRRNLHVDDGERIVDGDGAGGGFVEPDRPVGHDQYAAAAVLAGLLEREPEIVADAVRRPQGADALA